MPARRTRKASSYDLSDGQQAHELKLTKRKELFIQQIEKEAQDRINEMEANLNKLLASIDRLFKIELIKVPQSLQTTLINDLMTEDDTSVGEVTMALSCASPEIQRPLTRKPSKKALKDAPVKRSSALNKPSPVEGKKKTKKTLHNSRSTGCASSVIIKRTQARVKAIDSPMGSGVTFSGQLSRSLGDELMATATIKTAHGETLLLSEYNKDDINIDLLDDTALNQIQKLKDLLDYLYNKVKINNTR